MMLSDTLPRSPFQMILTSGIFGYLIVLCGLAFLVGTILSATWCTRKIALVMVVLSTAPLFLGVMGTTFGLINCFRNAAMYPTATYHDLAAGIFVSLFTTLLGTMVGGTSLVANGIIAVLKKPMHSAETDTD